MVSEPLIQEIQLIYSLFAVNQQDSYTVLNNIHRCVLKSHCADGGAAPNNCDPNIDDLPSYDTALINVRGEYDYYDEEVYVCCAELSIVTESSCSDRPNHV